ncbi:MAG: hypothetical protein OXF44_08930 [Anaerolineaceae bacterium]|nr:hypothetical protein [Anaerolineaceae bacterium]
MTSIGRELTDCGLLQFGLIGRDPWRLHIDLLPSYPELLHKLATLAEVYVEGVDRLLAANGAMAWGSALALRRGIPLVYCRGDELVGAYDIGHPTLLLASGQETDAELLALVERAARVGLQVCVMVALLDSGRDCLAQVPVHSLVNLEDLVQQRVSEGSLPAGQGRLIKRWLLNRRQGSTGP